MKKFAIVILSMTATLSAFAQTKTVTNQDLEKFRQQRIAADRDLKEKYAEMGTTAEEVEKRRQQKRAEMEQYSDQLRKERIEMEIAKRANELNSQIDALNAQMAYLNNQGFYYPGVYAFSYPLFGFGGNRFLFKHLRNLPPNARFVQEHAIMYPNTPGFNRQFFGRGKFNGSVRGGFVGRFHIGGGRSFGAIKFGGGFGGGRGFGGGGMGGGGGGGRR